MITGGNKKNLNIFILEILRRYTDENHSLTQQEILKLLEQNYDVQCDRRSVKANVLSLKEMGYDISMESGYRLLSREFDDAELRILIDSVLFSKSISTKQAKGLIEKLRGLGSKYFNAKVSHVSNLPELQHTDNKQALYSLDVINDAISGKKKVSFTYNEIGTDFKLRKKKEAPYIVSPYQIVANNGRFYLIANVDKHDNVAHFRVDKMTEVKILEDKIKPMRQVKGLENGLNLPKHMAEHIYMFSGDSIYAKIRADRFLMTELVDWFGKDFQILKETDDSIEFRVLINEMAIRFWALQYGPYVEVLEPPSLRDKLKEDITAMSEKYLGRK